MYTTPCLATQARIYVGATQTTAFTVTGTKEITLDAASGDTVYAYWENEPPVRVEVADFIESSEGWHRIVAVPTAEDITLDHYLSTADGPWGYY